MIAAETPLFRGRGRLSLAVRVGEMGGLGVLEEFLEISLALVVPEPLYLSPTEK